MALCQYRPHLEATEQLGAANHSESHEIASKDVVLIGLFDEQPIKRLRFVERTENLAQPE